MKVISNPSVKGVFARYPRHVRPKIEALRKLIVDSAKELPEVKGLEETLKWGEPSYITKYGSTIRIDWKDKSPDTYQIYFKCTSKLVPTFRELFGNLFKYENTRAIVFDLDDTIPETELKACIKAGLMYHKVKQLELLGMAEP